MTADVELLPCPFCGNEVQDDEGCFQSGGFRFPATPVWSVRCGNPECNADVNATSEATAVAAWNRRATTAKDAEIEALRAELDRLRGEHVRVRRDRNAAEARAERLSEALRELLTDTQHKDHDCGDADWCPVIRARAALNPTAAQEGNE